MTKKEIREKVRIAAASMGQIVPLAGWEVVCEQVHYTGARWAWNPSFSYRKLGEGWRQFGRGQESFIDCLARVMTR